MAVVKTNDGKYHFVNSETTDLFDLVADLCSYNGDDVVFYDGYHGNTEFIFNGSVGELVSELQKRADDKHRGEELNIEIKINVHTEHEMKAWINKRKTEYQNDYRTELESGEITTEDLHAMVVSDVTSRYLKGSSTAWKDRETLKFALSLI